ncbi:meiosis-specific protein MEI4 [Xenentodon cancila]
MPLYESSDGSEDEEIRSLSSTSQGHVTMEENRARWLSMNIRLALAVAVIKNKPPSMSGREYAEALASELKRQEGGWREKVQELQQEVLRLRQEKLIIRVTKGSTQAADIEDRMDNLSQDLFSPGSLVSSAELQPDSDSETPDLLLQEPHLAALPPLPPPTPPQLLLPPSHHADAHRVTMFPHVQFLQSLCALHRAEGSSRGLEALWFSPDGDLSSVFADTVFQLLDSVVAACRDPPALGPPDLMLQACQVAAGALDLFCSQRLPSVEFRSRVEAPLTELTQMLLHSHQPGRLRAAEELTEYLMVLGSSSVAESFLIRHVLSEINAVADQLWQASQESSGLDRFPVDCYQNSCHLFMVLEKLLQKSKAAGSRAEPGSEQMSFLSQLEGRLSVLSQEFPLFSIYMWKIGGILTPSFR